MDRSGCFETRGVAAAGFRAEAPARTSGQAKIVAAARPERAGEHADAGPILDHVTGIENIDDVEAQGDRLPTRNVEFMRHPGVDLRIRRKVIRVGEA